MMIAMTMIDDDDDDGLQGRIQEFAKGGPVPPISFLSPSFLPFPSPSPPP